MKRVHIKKERSKGREKAKALNKIFGEIGLQQGVASERYFDEILTRAQKEGRLPPWLHRWEHTEKNSLADKVGTDFVIKTDRGDICVNIKSSAAFAIISEKRFKYRTNVLIVVNILNSYERNLSEIISTLGREYRSLPRVAAVS
jgi:hypothetical protein